jgi:catechol 2,3-dioxygenase-like lactoylglutathione lyase family enzyme
MWRSWIDTTERKKARGSSKAAAGLCVFPHSILKRWFVMAADVYVMPSFPTLNVSDLAASTRWYRDMLQFQVVFELPNRLVHLRRQRYQDLLLVPGPADFFTPSRGEVGRGVSLYFAIGGPADVDAFASQATTSGAKVVEGPVNRPWNVREVVFRDPDGYRLVFGGGPLVERQFEEVVGAIKDSTG